MGESLVGDNSLEEGCGRLDVGVGVVVRAGWSDGS